MAANQELAYLLINGQLWLLLEDGRLVQLEDWAEMNAALSIIDVGDFQLSMNAQGQPVLLVNDQTFTLSNISPVDIERLWALNDSSPNSTVMSGGGSVLLELLPVQILTPPPLPDSGYQTHGQPDNSSLFVDKDADAITDAIRDNSVLTVHINDDKDINDIWLNAKEAPNPDIFGETGNVVSGLTVVITVTDSNGDSLQFTTLTNGSGYQVTNVDLSSLAEGPLTVKAVLYDDYGHTLSAQTGTLKDTLASGIAITTDTGSDNVLNAQETQNGFDVSGQFQNIHPDNLSFDEIFDVTITAFNENNPALVVEQTAVLQADGTFTLQDLDISALADGNISLLATVTDQAGNPATIESQFIKDTLAAIDVEFLFDSGAVDGYYNANDISQVDIKGFVTGIEDSQKVTVVFSDDDNATPDITINNVDIVNGEFTLNDQDLSALDEGSINVTVSAEDAAGNPASAQDAAIKDTQAGIYVKFLDDVYNKAEVDGNEVQIRVILVNITADSSNPVDVTYTFTDSLNQTVTGTVTMTSHEQVFTVQGVNFNTLAEGEVKVTGEALDLAGNESRDADTTIKDTIAEVSLMLGGDKHYSTDDSDGNSIVEASEVKVSLDFNAMINGSLVQSVENGQEVIITFEGLDVSGLSHSAQVSTTVTGATQDIEVDLLALGFSDGAISATATVQDTAGNIASSPDTADSNGVIDVTAEINLAFDGDANYSMQLDGTSGNVDGPVTPEVSEITLTGNVFKAGTSLATVEDGQIITITIEGVDRNTGSPISFVTTAVVGQSTADVSVASGEFVSDVINLLDPEGDGSISFADGGITATATVQDEAGNTAISNTAEAFIDTELAIDINAQDGSVAGQDGSQLFDLRQGASVVFEGETDSEPGQTITMVLTDGTTSNSFTGLVGSDGHWKVEGINAQGLDANKPWYLTAQVEDAAGNTAIDDLPSIILPTDVTLDEALLNTQDVVSQSSIILSENAVHSISSNQPELSSITSLGQSISLTVTSTMLTATRSDGTLVFSANLSGQVLNISLFEAIDSGQTPEAYLFVESLQTDADGTTEMLYSPVLVQLTESAPNAVDDNFAMVEASTATGNVLDNDSALDAPSQVISVEVAGKSYNVNAGAPATIAVAGLGNLSLASDGTWEFAANRNIDNSVLQQFSFTYTIEDRDGQTDSANVTLAISDGEAGTVINAVASIEENTLGQSQSVDSEMTIAAGSDDIDPNSIAFADSMINLLPNDLTSEGASVQYEFLDEQTLVAFTGANSSTGTVIFTANLSVLSQQANGDVTVQSTLILQQPLDHQSADQIFINLPIIANDTDGTPVTQGNIAWTINDGANPVAGNSIVAGDDVQVAEAGVPTAQAVDSGKINVVLGSDEVVDIVFADSTTQPNLTSQGKTINYTVAGNEITGFITVNGSDIDVFKALIDTSSLPLTSDSLISYDFTLYQGVDQSPDGSIDIPLKVIASDYDGDSTEASLDITVTDDNSQIVLDNVSLLVSETPSADDLNIPTTASGNINIQAGADALTDIRFDIANNAAVTDESGNAITQNGKALTWQVNGNELLAVNGQSDTVFSVTLPATFAVEAGASASIAVSVELLQSLDHLSGDGHFINFDIPVNIIDSDSTSQQATIYASIADGKNPVITSTSATLNVDEQVLETTSEDVASTTVAIVKGSDAIKTIVVDTDEFNLLGLTSGGLAVVLVENSEGVYLGQAVDGAGNVVSTVFTVSTKADGTVEFLLQGVLDHPEPTVGADRNNLSFDLQLKAVDADNDSSNNFTLTIDVTDDIPQVSTNTPSLDIIEGQDFSANILEPLDSSFAPNEGADGSTVTAVTYTNLSTGASQTAVVPASGNVAINLIGPSGDIVAIATIYSDGRIEAQTQATLSPSDSFTFPIDFTLTDSDGDEVIQSSELNVFDEVGNIELGNTVTNEDTSLVLDLTLSPGDLDVQEEIFLIRFDKNQLDGGTLQLNDTDLAVDSNGNPEISWADFNIDPTTGVVTFGSSLVFIPNEHSSNFDKNYKLSITAFVAPGDGDFTTAPSITDPNDPAVRSFEQSFTIDVNSVADNPEWDDASSTYNYSLDEDASFEPVMIAALHGDNVTSTTMRDDQDGSEVLSYRLQIASPASDNLIIKADGKILANGDTFSDINSLSVKGESNRSGQFVFNVVVVSTEQDNGDTSEALSPDITVNINAVADELTLTTRNENTLEDQAIALDDLFSGLLQDNDGSETLYYELKLPTGWALQGPIGSFSYDGASDTYTVQDADKFQVSLMPAEDISSIDNNGDFTMQVNAVSVESGNGDTFETGFEDVVVHVQGVADAPEITAGAGGTPWVYNETTQTLTIDGSYQLDEDNLLSLDIVFATKDDQATEINSVLVKNLPEGVRLVDATLSTATLKVVGFENGSPIYQVPADDIKNIYIEDINDFSGELRFDMVQVSTEPDGDTLQTDISVIVPVSPVVDTTTGSAPTINGLEDANHFEAGDFAIDLSPQLKDVDGSEQLTNAVIHSVTAGVILLDGTVVNLSSPLDIVNDVLGGDASLLKGFMASGRLSYQPPEDASVTDAAPIDLRVNVTYEVTDTSETGSQTVSQFNDDAVINVEAVVEFDTRLSVADGQSVFVSDDGSAIDLTGTVFFVDEDLDGSEVLDYIFIDVPEVDGWTVSSTDGRQVIYNGEGRWLIEAAGLSDNSTQESMAYVLENIMINTDHDTQGPTAITVGARVVDGGDGAIISTEISVDFTNTQAAEEAYQPFDVFTGNIISADEDAAVIDIGGQLATTNANGDTAGNADGAEDDVISYRIDVSDLPAGAKSSVFSGVGMQAEYDASGDNVVAYVFPESALASLQITNLAEHFAGTLDIPIHAIAVDPNGDTEQTVQHIQIEVAPIVDGLDNSVASVMEIYEDTPTAITNIASFIDSNIEGQGIEGLDISQPIIITTSNGVILSGGGVTPTGNANEWELADPSKINELYVLPPLNFPTPTDEYIHLTIAGSLVDNAGTFASGQVDQGAQDIDSFLLDYTIKVLPVTDEVNLQPSVLIGDEDSQISLAGLNATFVDTDGTENVSFSLTGVPSGAVLINTSTGQLLDNGGKDGGSVDGEPTYIWAVDSSQLANIALIPPRDFSGTITLKANAISEDKNNGEFVQSEALVEVLVQPIADGVQIMGDASVGAESDEGAAFDVAINAETLEVQNPDETIVIKITTLTTSDPSALVGLESIQVGGDTASFHKNPLTGMYVAELVTSVDAISSFTVNPGELAFGQLDFDVAIASVDTALGITDISDFTTVTLSHDIAPAIDSAILTILYNTISSADARDIPVIMDVSLQNPAEGETAYVEITGLPSNYSFTNGTETNGVWQVEAVELTNLAIVSPDNSGDESFDLTITAFSQYQGETLAAPEQYIHVDVIDDTNNTLAASADNHLFIGGSGDDVLEFASAKDTAIWQAGDQGTGANDTVQNFDVTADSLNIADMLQSMSAASISLIESSGDSIIEISDAGIVQNIILQGTSFDDLYGGDASGVDANVILQQMVDDQVLVIN